MKTAIVTGAGGNLGQAVVKKFIAEKYKVVGTVTANDKGANKYPKGKFESAVVDLTDEFDTNRFVKKVIKTHTNIDAAILTVGGFSTGKIKDTAAEDIARQYKLNFETAYNAARPIFVHMLRQMHGRIFLIGSKPGLSAANSKDMVAYSLAKSLLCRLAELMNEEAKGTNVVTTVVVPSTIDTPQNRKAMPDADYKKWVTPEAIAAAIYFYTTDEAAIIRQPVVKVYNNA